jgi:hypothetical protein
MSASQIKMLDLRILQERAPGALGACLPHGQHVATVTEGERGARVLLDEDDTDPVPVDLTDALERY